MSFLQPSDYQDSDAKLTRSGFAIKPTITKVMFSTDALVEDIKLVVKMKDEFEYGYESKSKASFAIFGQSKF